MSSGCVRVPDRAARWAMIPVIALICWAIAAPAASFAQSTQPSRLVNGTTAAEALAAAAKEPPSARGEGESRPINRTATPTTQAARTAAPPASPFDTQQVVLSLGLVIGLIFVLRWSAKRLFPGQAGVRASRAVQVVSRTAYSPKQQFLLLQVGRRLVVVADAGGNMSPMCEITDADEVAELLGQIRSESSASPLSRSFTTLFGRKREQFEAKPEPVPTSSVESEDSGDAHSGETDLEVGMTREEISGLMDKVRLLSRQFKRP